MQIHLDVWVEDVPTGVAWAIDCGATEAVHQPENRQPQSTRADARPRRSSVLPLVLRRYVGGP